MEFVKGKANLNSSVLTKNPLFGFDFFGKQVKIMGSFECLKGKVMPEVRLREHEPFEIALRRFKRICEKTGMLSEIRRREFYEKPTSVRKRKAAAAVKRQQKKTSMERARTTRTHRSQQSQSRS